MHFPRRYAVLALGLLALAASAQAYFDKNQIQAAVLEIDHVLNETHQKIKDAKEAAENKVEAKVEHFAAEIRHKLEDDGGFTWTVALEPTPITRLLYENVTEHPATCFKIYQTGHGGAAPPTALTINGVASACARTNQTPTFTVDGIAQEGAGSALYFGQGTAKFSSAGTNSSSTLVFTLPAWATGQQERIVCINTNIGRCGTFAKICNDRATCDLTLSRIAAASKASKWSKAPASVSVMARVQTEPLATASHGFVLELVTPNVVAATCTGDTNFFQNVADAFEVDARAQLYQELGAAAAAKIVKATFTPELCSVLPDPTADGGNSTDRLGISGWLTVTGPPDIVDDVLMVLDKDDAPANSTENAVCTGLGGDSCAQVAAVVATSFTGAVDPSNTVTYSPLMQSLQTYLASGFNILQYDPVGAFSSQQTTKLDVSNWITNAKIYDMDSLAAACSSDSCFSQSSSCSSSISVTSTASSAERQSEAFGEINADAEYLGVTASASASFRTTQDTMTSANGLSIKTAASCAVLTFNLPYGSKVKFTQEFLDDVRSALDAITFARVNATTKDPTGEGRRNLVNAFTAIYNNYGTHIPTSISYGGLMSLELLMGSSSLKSTFKDEAKVTVAVQHAVADLTASGGATSAEAKELLSSTSKYSYVTIPALPTVALSPLGAGGYTVDPQEWTNKLVAAPKETLYPSIIKAKGLAELFAEAAAKGSTAALQFGSLTKAQMAEMGLLSKAFLAYIINDKTQWPPELPMPPLLQNPNYLKDGKCVASPYIVRLDESTDYGATFTCVTCLRGVSTMPTKPAVSLSNPDYTDSCYVDGGQVKATCGECTACGSAGSYAPMCKAGGIFKTPATCDDCVQCTDTDLSACVNNNNYDNKGQEFAYGRACGCVPAQCNNGVCVQCLTNKHCADYSCCKAGADEDGHFYSCDHNIGSC